MSRKHLQHNLPKNRQSRRSFLGKLLAGAGIFSASQLGTSIARAESGSGTVDELRFPDEPAEHNVVYQFNKADADYHKAVLFSVGAMLRKYGDNIKIVVTCFGPGIHILSPHPKRPVAKEIQERVSSLAQYGVEFHACGNTMKSLKWTEKDLHPFVSVVEVGAADLLELQEKGFSYISW